MKTRQSFVANSSSSSFILISLGEDEILNEGYDEDCEVNKVDTTRLEINSLMKQLEEAKAKGITHLDISYGASYDG
jgi:hypothetical protein